MPNGVSGMKLSLETSDGEDTVHVESDEQPCFFWPGLILGVR